MMTTALMSTYLMVEMPNDQPFNFGGGQACTTDDECGAGEACIESQFGGPASCRLGWSIDFSGNPIPLEDTLNPASPNFMVFDDRPPLLDSGGAFGGFDDCRGSGPPSIGLETPTPYSGYSMLFQRLFGFTPRYPFAATFECVEHASEPYYTASDLSDWRLVTITDKPAGDDYVKPFDLPTLRGLTELPLAMPRVGFYTTPAYLALWNTNDSNQHRVTANQTLLVALGQSLTSDSSITPVSTVGLDEEHAVENSECYGCHKILDPLREFWSNQFDYNDRNDFPAQVFGGVSNPRPDLTGGVLAFRNVNAEGASMLDLGGLLAQVVDENRDLPDQPVARFALEFAQKLCFFADSAACSESDPEFRRVAMAFESSGYDFRTLVRELFASPLVTGAAPTETFTRRNPIVSVSRRDQFCQTLSNRLGLGDVCALGVAFPFSNGFGAGNSDYATQSALFRLAGSLPADAFSRGSEVQVTPPDPTLFYRAASEMVCESVAALVVDADGSRYSSSDVPGALADMVQTVMGYTSGDPHYAEALQILGAHYDEAAAVDNVSASDALRSTFSLACQSPTSLSFGL